MPRLLIDGTALSPAAKGVGRYSYHLIDGLTHRLDAQWSMTVLFTESPAPTFTGPNKVVCRYIPRVPELVRSLAVVPAAAVMLRSDVVLAPMDGTTRSAGRPRITVVHDIFELLDIASNGARRTGFVAAVRRCLYDRNLRTAAAVICNSKFTAREAIQRHGLNPRNVHLGYCGVDERFYDKGGPSASDCWPEIAGWKGYVLTFATGDPREGSDLCPRIWAEVRRAIPDVGLIVAGAHFGSVYVEKLRAGFRREGLTEGRDVAFLPFLAEAEFAKLLALYRDADFYLELSRHEGFGMQLAEAMATGTTCISSAAGALGETDGGFALMVEPPDAGTFAAAIVDAYRQSLHRRDNSEQVAHTRKFNWHDVADTVAAELFRFQHRVPAGSRQAGQG